MNTVVKILVVEDEYITQKIICNHLEGLGYNISGTAMSYDEAVEVLDNNNIELALLDITIKGEKTGIDIANYINETSKIPHIFLTAYSDTETINKAVKTNPYGYIIKPFEKINIYSAIELAINNFNTKNSILQDEKYFFAKINDVYTKIIYNDIEAIESQKNYLLVNTNGKILKYRSTLSEFLKTAPDYFVQVHKGFIVNTKKVTGYTTTHIHIGNIKIPTSRLYKTEIENKIGKK